MLALQGTLQPNLSAKLETLFLNALYELHLAIKILLNYVHIFCILPTRSGQTAHRSFIRDSLAICQTTVDFVRPLIFRMGQKEYYLLYLPSLSPQRTQYGYSIQANKGHRTD